MRACPNCGELVASAANFCHMCGEPAQDEPPPPVPPPVVMLVERRTGPAKLVAAAAVLLIVVAAVAAWLVRPGPADPADPADPGTDPPTAGPSVAGPSIRPGEPSAPPSVPPPAAVLAAPGSALVSVALAGCPGCVVTAVPADGTAPQQQTVGSEQSVGFTLPRPSTLGLGFTVAHPQGFGAEGGPNVAVLQPLEKVAGSRVTVGDVAQALPAGVCWAGTVSSAAVIVLSVEAFGDGTAAGGLRVWADPAVPALEATVVPDGDGTLEAQGLDACRRALASIAG